MLRAAVILSALCLALLPTFADTVTLRSGRVIEGVIIERTDAYLRVRQNVDGLQFVSKHKLADVAAIDAPDRIGTPYARIPCIGTFGESITADSFSESLNAAKADGAKMILLQFDSPGGAISDMAKILDIIHANPELHFVAVVKNAISAAAITAMACPDIVMLPDSNIGAAVAFKVGPDGTPQNIEEKFASVIRSFMRQAATMGRHDTLWVRAMTEPEVELYLTPDPASHETAGGKLSDEKIDETSRLLKPAGRILTMTDQEATGWGLAKANVVSMGDVRTALHLAAWYEVSDRSWRLGLAAAKAPEAKAAEMGNLQSQYEQARRTYDDQDARVRSAYTLFTTLRTRYRDNLAALDTWRKEQLASAGTASPSDPAMVRVQQAYARRRADLDQRFLPDLDRTERQTREAAAELNKTAAEIKALKVQARATAKN